jgi:hypothetical protein
MAFVQAGVGPIEILRRAASESPMSSLGESRLYNQAQIRVLLSDNPAELPGGTSDSQNIRLANRKMGSGPDYSGGVPVNVGGTTEYTYFGEGSTASGTTEQNWLVAQTELTLVPDGAPVIVTGSSWNLLDGWLRVEYRNSDGSYTPVTQEWLQLGFARGYKPPNATNPNTVNPNAILILQQLADRYLVMVDSNGHVTTTLPDGMPDTGELAGSSPYTYGAGTQNNWYPINIYDAREGELRENRQTTSSCHVGGVMNLVEIDVNNLKKWLNGTIPGSGRNVEYTSQNGYILYFSDRRGMMLDTNVTPNVKTGAYGFEDVVNPSSASGAPNGRLDAGEDVDGNGQLDTWGKGDLGLGFNNVGNPNATVTCITVARPNWVSGARHAVRLEDGALGELPVRLDNGGGGFTLASENPAYILGDYNARGGFGDPHVSAAAIADTVTLLSNSWSDYASFSSPADSSGRTASETYFRVAIASGRNLTFPKPTFSTAKPDFGTDGGVHNFLRFLENWTGVSANYLGSMAALYYSQYDTGIFKCCDMVYQAPNRNYKFDTDFLDLSKLPPGTPRFRDVESVGFQQVF